MLNVSSLDDALDPFYDLIVDLQNTTDTLDDQIGALQGSVDTMTYVAVAALIVAIAIGGIAIFMAWRKP